MDDVILGFIYKSIMIYQLGKKTKNKYCFTLILSNAHNIMTLSTVIVWIKNVLIVT